MEFRNSIVLIFTLFCVGISYALEVKSDKKEDLNVEPQQIEKVEKLLKKFKIKEKQVALIAFNEEGCAGGLLATVTVTSSSPVTLMKNKLNKGTEITFCKDRIAFLLMNSGKIFNISGIACENEVVLQGKGLCHCGVAKNTKVKKYKVVKGSHVYFQKGKFSLYRPGKSYQDKKLKFKFEEGTTYKVSGKTPEAQPPEMDQLFSCY